MVSFRLVVPLLCACGAVLERAIVRADCTAQDSSTCAVNTAGQALLQRVAKVNKITGPETDGVHEPSERTDEDEEDIAEPLEGIDTLADSPEVLDEVVAEVVAEDEADIDEEDIDDYVEDVVNELGETNAAILLDDGKLWPEVANKKCDPQPPLTKRVKTQTACQTIAEENGHVYYQYYARRKKCGTTMTCVNQKHGGQWKIYKRGQSDEEIAEEAKAEAAAAVERAAAAAEKERIGKITESWPRSPWPQCGYGKSRCSMEQVPLRNIMECQIRALAAGHTHYQYTPYKSFGLCGTSTPEPCERAVQYPWKTCGQPSNWTIYTWGTCVEWTTRTTTTTTTVTQAQNPVDTIMGTKSAVGGCNDPGTRPDSATDAWVAGSPLGYSLERRVFKVPGVPHDPTKHWNYGPASQTFNYQHPKRFYSVTRTDGKEGVVWIDATNENVYMTWFAADLKDSASVLLYTPETGESLQAATSNSQDGIVLITALNAVGDAYSLGTVYALRFDSTSGAQVKKSTVPGHQLWKKFDSAGSAAWDLKNNTIAVFLSRLLPMMADGKNHEGLNVKFLDGSTLAVKQGRDLVTSHSFSNTMLRSEDLKGTRTAVYGVDLGDNNPRGIHLSGWWNVREDYSFANRWTDGGSWKVQHSDKVVYTMKASHSNDNGVYGEIAHPGPTEVDDGLLVFFTGEQAPLDNTKLGKWLNTARDIGFVKVSSDLRTIMSPGATETGRTIGAGNWFDASNRGINFITNHSSKDESASRLKTFKLSSGRILLTYEIWTSTPHWKGGSYIRTEMMEVDKDGNVVRRKWDTCFKMQLPSADDPLVRNGKGIAYAGNDEGLIRYEICAGNECS